MIASPLLCATAEMMQEDDEAATGPSSTAGAATNAQAGPLSAAQKTTMGLVLRDIFFKKDGGCHSVKLAQLVEEYNKKASTPASAEQIDQASLFRTELLLDTMTLHCSKANMQHTWSKSYRALESCCLGTSCFCTPCQALHAQLHMRLGLTCGLLDCCRHCRSWPLSMRMTRPMLQCPSCTMMRLRTCVIRGGTDLQDYAVCFTAQLSKSSVRSAGWLSRLPPQTSANTLL